MKRIFTWIVVLAVSLSVVTVPASASGPSGDVIDLGDGFYMTEATIQQSYSRANDIVVGHNDRNVYYGTTFIGTATLWGTFDISGSTATAIDSSITGSGHNGGSYTGGTSYCSRNTVYGTANFNFNGIRKSLSLSISCSPDGTLS